MAPTFEFDVLACPVDQTPLVYNPANGWIQNTNNSPWTAAGPNRPKQRDYPSDMDARMRERSIEQPPELCRG